MIRRGRKFKPRVATEKQHIEMFSVANFVLSKKYLVKKQFVLNIFLLKKPDFRVVFYKIQRKMAWDRKGINNEII